MAYAGKPLAQMTASQRTARIAQLVSSHNTAAIPTQYLPASLRAGRQAAILGKQPITPGSAITNKDLATQRRAATDLQFGPNAVAKQQQQAKDVGGPGGWYDQYLAELAKHSQNVGTINQQAQTNITGIGAGVRGLDQSQLNQQVTGAQTDAASRGATADPGLAQRGSDASAVRQALLASLQGTQNQHGADASTYADLLAHVVGPGQKLQAQAQEAGKVTDLRKQIGSFGTKYESDVKANEAKTVLANQALNLNTAKAVSTASNQTANRNLSAHKFDAGLNKYGVTNGAWSAWGKTTAGQAKRQAAVDSYNASKKSAKTTKPASGPGSLGAAAEQKQLSTVLKVAQAFRGNSFQVKTTDQYGQTVIKSVKGFAAIKKQLQAQNVDPRVIAAAESVYRNKGAVGPDGVKQLHSLGIHVAPNFKVVTK